MKAFLPLLIITSSYAFCQNTIKGKITDSDSNPLSGVLVKIQNEAGFTVTDSDGNFSINSEPGSILEISYVGFETKKIKVGNQTQINVSMVASVTLLDDVVVVGYGSMSKKDLTGAVGSVYTDEFLKGNINNPLQQIQSKVAGVLIVQPGGDPNGDFTVRVRGATSLEGQPPLLVVDGVAIDDFYTYMHTLNPADIESYNILKDASAAAIYGARGANGVLLITTKKGKSGMSVELNEYTSIEQISKKLDVLSSNEWRKATQNLNLSYLDKGANTSWQDAITQTGVLQSHTISVTGGNDQLSFRGSVGYLKQSGIIINTGKDVLTSRLTATQKGYNGKLQINYAINTSLINRDFLPGQTSTSFARTQSDYGVLTYVNSYLPIWPTYNSDGTYFLPPNNNPNPLFVLNKVSYKQRENFYQSSIKGDYEIVRGLKVGGIAALSLGETSNDIFEPVRQGSTGQASASKSVSNKKVYTGDFHFNYKRTISKHLIDVTGVYEYNDFVNDGFGVKASGFLVPELLTNNLGGATTVFPSDLSSFKNEVKLISFLGRVVYEYDNRYVFTANFRRDGSSKFGPNNRWGNFPSFALAWKINNESFLKNVKGLNLKARISYGLTGNQESIGPYLYRTLYQPSGSYLYDGQFLKSYAVTQESNPDLKWESRRSLNAGLDFSLFSDRIFGTVDYFNDKTSGLLYLYGIPQPPFLANQVTANAASATNKGFETTLNASIITNSNFTWRIQGNIGLLRNKITGLLGKFKGYNLSLQNRDFGAVTGGKEQGYVVSKLQEGYPAGVFWLPQHAGFDSNGKELFYNYDGDGKLLGTSTTYTDQDRKYVNPTPKYSWGLSNNITYKRFDLNIFLRGVQGQKIYSNTAFIFGTHKALENSSNVTHEALKNKFSELPDASTYWIRDGSFMRLENVTLGYQFGKINWIKSLRAYCSASNLLVITKYNGIDPEVKTEGPNRYIDLNYYPKTRGYTLGLNISF